MAPKFFSKEWCEAVAQKANSDKEYLSKAKGFTVKYLFIVTDTPDDTDVKVLWDYNAGKVIFRHQASYETLKKIRDKQMTGLAAIGTKLWKIEGDLVKGMKYQPYNALIAEVQAQTPCEY
jgi:putative sterol carrier protein